MVIREATREDLDDIFSLWYELMDHHNGHSIIFDLDLTYDKIIKAELAVRYSHPDTKIFLCKEKDRVAGMIIASFKKTSRAFRFHKKGYIAETVVNWEFRGRGIGRKLFEKAYKWLKTSGADHIELQVSVSNEDAYQFWKSMGFNTVTKHMMLEISEDQVSS